MTAETWLGRVGHDLVKRLLWPARDRRDLGGDVQPGELVVTLVDDEGAPIAAAALWAELRQLAPAAAPRPALDDFATALAAATAAAATDDLGGVLALEAGFAALARAVKGAAGPLPARGA